jgi:hypothetical protein
MPKVGGKKYPYTKSGYQKAKEAAKKTGGTVRHGTKKVNGKTPGKMAVRKKKKK